MPASLRAWLLPVALGVAGFVGWACQDDVDPSSEPVSGAELHRDVLRSISDNLVIPATSDFASTAQDLAETVAEHAASPTAETRLAAQQAWRDTMLQWQRLELMQVGPAAASSVGVGGENIRDRIYSWPTSDACSVDRALAAEEYAETDFIETQLPWAYGLDALEYLLFAEGDAHSCPTQVGLDGPWAELGGDELPQRRAAYAFVVATAVAEQGQFLADRWAPGGGDFGAALAAPGSNESPFADPSRALNEVFRAMFYFESQTKDGKLGIPLGIVEGCPTSPPCTGLMEAPWSGDALAMIAQNLRALSELVQGGPNPESAVGFDDLLASVGEEQLARELLSRIETTIALAESFEGPLQEAADSDPEQVRQLYDAIRGISDILKGRFVMALTLSIPAEGAGDND